jgi:hypothetical protein
MVIVLATEHKGRWFKPGRGECIFKGDKNPHDFWWSHVARFYGILKKPASKKGNAS